MKCKNCGIDVQYSADCCPICGTAFTEEEKTELNKCVRRFPPYDKKKSGRMYNFGLYYFLFSLAVFIPCLIANCVIGGKPWCITVAVAAWLGFVVVGHTVLGLLSTCTKVAFNGIGLSAFFISLEYAAGVPVYSVEYVAPVLLFAAAMYIMITAVWLKPDTEWRNLPTVLTLFVFIFGLFLTQVFLGISTYSGIVLTLVDTVITCLLLAFHGKEIATEVAAFLEF